MTTISGPQIKAKREELGLSRKQLADDVGAHDQTIQKIERGDIKKSRFLLPIKQRLGMLPAAQGTVATTRRNSPRAATPSSKLADDLPCFVGHPDDAAEWSPMTLRAEPTWQIERPGALLDFSDAYAVMVGTNVMSPRFEAGETVYCAPHLPPVKGKDVCLRKEMDGGAMLILARLEDITPSGWVVRQHGKKNNFTVPKNQYPKCHRVLGLLCG